MRIGVLTGGGDCPGLNAVIRALLRQAERTHGSEIVGFRHGWKGMIDDDIVEMTSDSARGLLHRGGTVLGTSRTNPYRTEGGVDAVKATFAARHLDALVAIGGEDTLGVAHRLRDEDLAVVGVPKTIDNDLSATDFTFGFHSAVQTATDAIDRLHTTAESHDRVMVVEVMGRHAGWIALYSAIAGGADVVLVPEVPFDLDAVCDRIRARHARGAGFSIVVVAEGAVAGQGTLMVQDQGVDEFGHVRLGGIGSALGPEIESRTGYETRVTVLGHLLRGGSPTAFDRILASRFGIEAADAVHAGDVDVMVALRGDEIVRVPLEEAVRELKTVPPETLASVGALLA